MALFNFTGTFLRLPLVPLYAKSVGATTFEVGLIVSLFFGIAAFLAIPTGHLSDKLGRKLLILFGSGLTAITSLLLCFTHTPNQILLVYTIAGFGPPAFTPTIASYVGDISAQDRMGSAYGWYTLSAMIGSASGPAIGGLIAGFTNLRFSFLFAGLVTLIAFILAVIGLPSYERSKSVEHDIKKSLWDLTRNNKVLACWIATFCFTYAFGIFAPFFPLYGSSIGLGVSAIGFIFAVQALFNAVSRVPAGYISDKLGKRDPFIIMGMIILSFSLISFVLTVNLYVLILLSVFIGLSGGIAATLLGASIAESSGQEKRGAAMGGYSTSLYTGHALTAIIGGKIISSYSFLGGFSAAAFVCFIGSFLFYFIYKKS